MFLVVLLVTSVIADLEPTTTKTYDIEVPGSNPIRIIEGEPLWQTTTKTNFEHRSFNTRESSTDDSLQQFLEDYADSIRRNKNRNQDDEFTKEDKTIRNDSGEKGKSWDMIPYQKHNHPYDDKKGWVSMEPVPWSVSKISKWQSKYKPTNPKPWDDYESEEVHSVRPYQKPSTTNNYDPYYVDSKPNSRPIYSDSKPSYSDSRPTYADSRPGYTSHIQSKPIYPRPTAVYNQKVHVDYNNKYQHKHDENCKHTRPSIESEIITDGLPPNFPQPYDSNRRQGTEMHPDFHHFSGDGEWVLLSTTKGYKYPQERQRSLKIADSVGTRRGVRLTVLPPLKNSKVNMTTSHGGLLQVESTFQTVEQSRKQTMKRQKSKKKQGVKPNQVKPLRPVVQPTMTTTRKHTAPDSSAVLAAVGAGMIPATMAMLVPMALGGRRKRETNTTPKYLQVTLPRNM